MVGVLFSDLCRNGSICGIEIGGNRRVGLGVVVRIRLIIFGRF